jgi:hypothetical protein
MSFLNLKSSIMCVSLALANVLVTESLDAFGQSQASSQASSQSGSYAESQSGKTIALPTASPYTREYQYLTPYGVIKDSDLRAGSKDHGTTTGKRKANTTRYKVTVKERKRNSLSSTSRLRSSHRVYPKSVTLYDQHGRRAGTVN